MGPREPARAASSTPLLYQQQQHITSWLQLYLFFSIFLLFLFFFLFPSYLGVTTTGDRRRSGGESVRLVTASPEYLLLLLLLFSFVFVFCSCFLLSSFSRAPLCSVTIINGRELFLPCVVVISPGDARNQQHRVLFIAQVNSEQYRSLFSIHPLVYPIVCRWIVLMKFRQKNEP